MKPRTPSALGALELHTETLDPCAIFLIIEDEPIIAEVLRCLLEDEGAATFDYADSEEAAIAAAIARSPDLITSDVKLLAGTGPRAVSTIQRKLGDVPVIFVTGTPAECAPCNPPGRILRKPIDADELARAFHEMVPA